MSETKAPVKLNVGGGELQIPGYVNIDRKVGTEAYPLDWPDDNADEIRASHVLEHFGHRQTIDVLTDWVRALRPGGVLKVAVPDFDKCVSLYTNPQDNSPVEGYILGSQVDENDFHKAVFNKRKLWAALRKAGLIDVRPWKSQIRDCASLPVSLNLQGTKPLPTEGPSEPLSNRLTVYAAMSTPRLGFMDNFFSIYQSLLPHRIPFKKYTGAYWHQCLENCMEDIVAEGNKYDAILTIDYDTIFSKDDLELLMQLMIDHPEADAIAPIQSKRESPVPLLTIQNEDGEANKSQVDYKVFDPALTEIRTAHFGLTLIRTKALKDVPKPWLLPVPNEEGKWRENRIDADIYFWKHWRESGKTLYLANHVTVGHCELMVAWSNSQLMTIHQHIQDYIDNGKPRDVWE